MVWCVGCWVGNLEFNQFYLICLYYLQVKSFFIIEVLCGEGVLFCLFNGECFMLCFDLCGELVFWDIVVCVIDYEMKCLGIDCVYLDISYKLVEFIKVYFFIVYECCLDFGIDIIQ